MLGATGPHLTPPLGNSESFRERRGRKLPSSAPSSPPFQGGEREGVLHALVQTHVSGKVFYPLKVMRNHELVPAHLFFGEYPSLGADSLAEGPSAEIVPAPAFAEAPPDASLRTWEVPYIATVTVLTSV